MRKAGIDDYLAFAKKVLREITQKPISFEVFSDNLDEMKKQGLAISSWGDNVYVKVPITNTKGESTFNVVEFLSNHGVKVNVTALMTVRQTANILPALNPDTPSYISIFAGRIADTGIDPMPVVSECVLKFVTMLSKIFQLISQSSTFVSTLHIVLLAQLETCLVVQLPLLMVPLVQSLILEKSSL